MNLRWGPWWLPLLVSFARDIRVPLMRSRCKNPPAPESCRRSHDRPAVGKRGRGPNALQDWDRGGLKRRGWGKLPSTVGPSPPGPKAATNVGEELGKQRASRGRG